MDDDELAAAVFNSILEILRSNPDSASIADDILNEVAQGRFERKGVNAPRYELSLDTYDFDSDKVRRSTQNVTIAREFTHIEKARLALKALRRLFLEPKALTNYLSSTVDASITVRKAPDEEAGENNSVPHPFIRLIEPNSRSLRLSFVGEPDTRHSTLEELSAVFSSDLNAALETAIAKIESRLS